MFHLYIFQNVSPVFNNKDLICHFCNYLSLSDILSSIILINHYFFLIFGNTDSKIFQIKVFREIFEREFGNILKFYQVKNPYQVIDLIFHKQQLWITQFNHFKNLSEYAVTVLRKNSKLFNSQVENPDIVYLLFVFKKMLFVNFIIKNFTMYCIVALSIFHRMLNGHNINEYVNLIISSVKKHQWFFVLELQQS